MLIEHARVAPPTDFWGTVFPAYLGAVGSIISGIIALVALLVSIQSRGGLRSIQSSLNAANGTEIVESRSAASNFSSAGTLTGQASRVTNGEVIRAPVLWGVERDGRHYRLVNRSTTTAAELTAAEDVTDGGDGAFQVPLDLPVRVEPGGSLPFSIEKTLVSPAVTAVRITWSEESLEPRSVTLYV